MAVNVEQVKELLGNGLEPQVVAHAVGCDISYISQLLSDDDFAQEVSARRTLTLASHNKRDATIDGIEDKLLASLDELIDNRAFYKPRDILAAAATVNRMVRRGSPVHRSSSGVTNVVQIQIPTVVLQKITTNRNNEVIAAGEQTMITMPSHLLLRNLATEKDSSVEAQLDGDKNAGQRYRDALKYLPSGIETKIRA